MMNLPPYHLTSHYITCYSGGDQNAYMTYWADTEVQTIIQSKLDNITIGGTSAGLAVLGNWVYTAEDGTVYSDEALEVGDKTRLIVLHIMCTLCFTLTNYSPRGDCACVVVRSGPVQQVHGLRPCSVSHSIHGHHHH